MSVLRHSTSGIARLRRIRETREAWRLAVKAYHALCIAAIKAQGCGV